MCANRSSFRLATDPPRILSLAAIVLLSAATSTMAETNQPLSAIDWLSRSVAQPPVPVALPQGSQKPETGDIVVTPIAGPGPDGLGIVSSARSGLPDDFWGPTATGEAERLIRTERPDALPALRSLLTTILLAELAAPVGGGPAGEYFLTRVDKLLEMGNLDPALALLERPTVQTPEIFRRRFDIALLTGLENEACKTMRETPQIAPSFPARIFCLARGGDWAAAALSLRTGEALGFISATEADRLSRFLDPELYEGQPDAEVPDPVTPLDLRILEAIGQPVPTTTFPVAFAHSDLRSNAGWKTRIEAGERLARMGAISPNLLLGLYTEREPAASGGVWDRVSAIATLDAALSADEPDRIAEILPDVWDRMAEVELEVPIAHLFGRELARLNLPGAAGQRAFRLGLLSEAYESVARDREPADGIEPFLIGLAQGDVTGIAPPDQMGGAIGEAFSGAAGIDDETRLLLDQARLGEVVLTAMDDITEGAKGDLRRVTAGLIALRHVGLESVARRTALELLLLERRG
jgi:hypothetical protein